MAYQAPVADFTLSIYSGIDLLGKAFTAEGYCVVGYIDTKWGSDVRELHPPRGVFEGVIAGPPCQPWSKLSFLNPNAGKGLDWVVSEYARIVDEAQPAWFLMEEVIYAPMPLVPGYHVFDTVLTDAAAGGLQPRERRFSFGTRDGRMLYIPRYEQNGNGHGSGKLKQSVLGSGNRVTDADRVHIAELRAAKGAQSGGVLPRSATGHFTIEERCEAMGLPRDFADVMPFTMRGKQAVLGNGVPLALGRAVARAVKEAMAR